jgi:hypothetical protein
MFLEMTFMLAETGKVTLRLPEDVVVCVPAELGAVSPKPVRYVTL